MLSSKCLLFLHVLVLEVSYEGLLFLEFIGQLTHLSLVLCLGLLLTDQLGIDTLLVLGHLLYLRLYLLD